MEVIGLKWESLEEFEAHYHSIIRRTCNIAAPESDALIIGDIACELWSKTRKLAGRTPTNLSLDCCYLVLRITGNRVCIADMEDIALEVVKRPVAVWSFQRGKVWWKKPRVKAAILEVCGNGNPESILPLYEELDGGWGDEEE